MLLISAHSLTHSFVREAVPCNSSSRILLSADGAQWSFVSGAIEVAILIWRGVSLGVKHCFDVLSRARRGGSAGGRAVPVWACTIVALFMVGVRRHFLFCNGGYRFGIEKLYFVGEIMKVMSTRDFICFQTEFELKHLSINTNSITWHAGKL